MVVNPSIQSEWTQSQNLGVSHSFSLGSRKRKRPEPFASASRTWNALGRWPLLCKRIPPQWPLCTETFICWPRPMWMTSRSTKHCLTRLPIFNPGSNPERRLQTRWSRPLQKRLEQPMVQSNHICSDCILITLCLTIPPTLSHNNNTPNIIPQH